MTSGIGLRGFMKIKNDLGQSLNQDIRVTLCLIDFLIKPILLYPLQNIHVMLKQLLGVQKLTTNIGVLLELGRAQLNLSATKFGVKNWERIRIGKGDDLLFGS